MSFIDENTGEKIKYVHNTFDQLSLGMEASFSKRISEEEMRIFGEISGDTNPLHCDEEYAKSRKLKGKVVFGMLTAAVLSRLAGVYLPGKEGMLVTVAINFIKPVFVGDSLLIKGKVVDKKEFAKIVKIEYTITNQNAEQVSNGNFISKFI